MSNQLDIQRQTLAQMLAANRLTKVAGDQEIEHETPLDQTNLGKEQTNEINSNIEGVVASTRAAANRPHDMVQEYPNCQSLNRDALDALSRTGTSVNVMDQEGDAASLPKTASDYRYALASILNHMNKSAYLQKQAAEQAVEDFRTGTEVMDKFASLNENSTAEDLEDARNDLLKLASTNPMFGICRDHILMTKLAEDAMALAEAEGISPEDAAAALDQAAAADPSIMQEAEDEANGEAVADLADAEAQTDELMAGVQQLADNASAATGTEVTADDIMTAIDEVEAQAEQLGVPPEALIQAAMEDIQGGADAPEVTPEDVANAQAILDDAAANGISPDEVLQMAAEQMGGEAAPEGEPAPAAEPEGEQKTASCVARTPRAAYVQSLLHR